MKRTLPIALFILIALTIFTESCKKTTTTPTTYQLFGFLTLYDQYGAKVYSGIANDTVNILPIPAPVTAVIGGQAITDSNGKFVFNISQGQYDISVAKAGYGSILNSQFGFLGGASIDHDLKLSAIPNFYDSILTPPIDTLGFVVLNGTFSGTDIRKRTFAIFVGSTSTVSSAPANYKIEYSGTANANFTTFTLKIPVSDLNDAGFNSGSTVYFAAYGAAANFTSTSNVEDYSTGRTLYTALSANAATTSFVLP